MIGARQEVRAALNAADDELQRAGEDAFLDEISGELGFCHARRALCAGTSFVVLGDGEQAEREALAALALFAEMPECVRWAGELGARVDLGAARTLRGDLAGAEDSLEVVFALEPERRTEAVARRLTNLARVLRATRYRNAAEARRISDAIEDFTAFSLSRGVIRAFNQ
ncbi:MAG: hypothetical protein ACRDS0_06875 [Pseudonocardiaceae bacterium]